MANSNLQYVSAAKPVASGAISVAPVGTALPTDAAGNLNKAFTKLGYVNQDGLTNSVEMESDTVSAWGGDIILTTKTSRTETFQFTLVQALDPDVLKEVYGPDNVSGDLASGITINHNSAEMPHRAFVFDMLMTGNALKRIVVPDAQVTEVAEVKHVDGEPISYTVTLTCYAQADGTTVIEYIKSAQAPASGD